MSKPSKQIVKELLHTELEKVARTGYFELSRMVEQGQKANEYEIENEHGSYQVKIMIEPSSNSNEPINILGAIDGPGVFHLLGFVLSVTDVVQVNPPTATTTPTA